MSSTELLDQQNVLFLLIPVIGVGVIILFGALSIILCRRLSKTGFSPHRQVLLMRNNILYPNQHKDTTVSRVSSIAPLVPRSRVRVNRRRTSSDVTSILSEYEIPLDADWEFSRERLVVIDKWLEIPASNT